MRRELLRYHQLLRDQNSETYIIETWHTVNIAYSLKRSPGLVSTYIEEFKKTTFEIFGFSFTVYNQ